MPASMGSRGPSRAIRCPAGGDVTIMMVVSGSRYRSASAEPVPCTFCRRNVMKNKPPIRAPDSPCTRKAMIGPTWPESPMAAEQRVKPATPTRNVRR